MRAFAARGVVARARLATLGKPLATLPDFGGAATTKGRTERCEGA